MDCPKCNNLMVFESFEDHLETPRLSRFRGWRCLGCGNIFDPMIDAHRRNGAPIVDLKAKRRFVK